MSCSNNVKYSHKYPQLAFTLGNKWQQKNYVLMRHWEIQCASASRNCNRICNFFFFFGPPLFFFLLFFCFLKDSNTNALIPVHSPIPNHFFPQSTEWMVSSWLFTGKNGQLFSIAAHLSAKNEVESSCSCDHRRVENDSPSSWFFWRALIKCLNAEIVLLISLPIPAVLGCKWGS